MQCKVSWMGEGLSFVAQTGSGHLLAMDASPEAGGRNLAARPMELLLSAAGGCSAIDVVMILQRGRHHVSNCVVELKGERATTEPKVFTSIHLHFRISGQSVPNAAVERAVALSRDKYCSALQMLNKTATITTSFEVLEQGAAAPSAPSAPSATSAA